MLPKLPSFTSLGMTLDSPSIDSTLHYNQQPTPLAFFSPLWAASLLRGCKNLMKPLRSSPPLSQLYEIYRSRLHLSFIHNATLYQTRRRYSIYHYPYQALQPSYVSLLSFKGLVCPCWETTPSKRRQLWFWCSATSNSMGCWTHWFVETECMSWSPCKYVFYSFLVHPSLVFLSLVYWVEVPLVILF